ncbi:hypothetical protein ABPG75_012334 [Micractinium tetrahymenae]
METEGEFVRTAWKSEGFADVIVAITVRPQVGAAVTEVGSGTRLAHGKGPLDDAPPPPEAAPRPEQPQQEQAPPEQPQLPAELQAEQPQAEPGPDGEPPVQHPAERLEHQQIERQLSPEQQQQQAGQEPPSPEPPPQQAGQERPPEPPQQAAVVRLPCIRFELAKASLTFRAQLQRWAGPAGATLEVAVEADEVQAMQALLEFIHTRQLPPGLPAEELCRLLRLAHFYAVDSLQETAAAALVPLARSLPGSTAAAIYTALQPLAEEGSPLARAAAACLERLQALLTPLEVVFTDEELGALFDELPLAAAAAITKPSEMEWNSQETAFMASLRWLAGG